MKTYPFSALFSRMKYITRWCLMRSTRPESLSEHTADTAMLAHTLCLIGRHCTGTGAALRPEVVATAAIYHDAPEILTGDMPTPVKYKNDALRTAYKAVEHESARVMASLQPEELQAETQVWLTGSVLNDAERKILKAADRLSAVIKCIEEDRGGRTCPARGIPVIALLREGCGPGMPGPYITAACTPHRSMCPHR